MNKVLDEIGIEISGKVNQSFLYKTYKYHSNSNLTILKMHEAPNPSKSKLGASSKVTDDDEEEIKNMLARLKA